MTLQIDQSYDYRGDDWWQWAIWLAGPSEELDEVRAVTYILHESFPQPVRRVTSRDTSFRLESGGWGRFTIFATAELKDGSSLQLEHDLDLRYPDDPAPGAESRYVRAGADPQAEHGVRQVFLSYNAEDSGAAVAIKAALEPFGIRVADSGSLTAGIPLQVGLQRAIGDSDVYVFLSGGDQTPGPFVEQEAELASRLGKPRLVLGDSDRGTPASLRGIQRIALAEGEKELPRVLRDLRSIAGRDS